MLLKIGIQTLDNMVLKFNLNNLFNENTIMIKYYQMSYKTLLVIL